MRRQGLSAGQATLFNEIIFHDPSDRLPTHNNAWQCRAPCHTHAHAHTHTHTRTHAANTLHTQADSSTVTIHDYSIRVQRLPQDAAAEELVEFFGQYGEVGCWCSEQ